jgi:CBS domain-containing protein
MASFPERRRRACADGAGDREERAVTVAAILGQKSHSIITAKAEETLKGVCDLLAHHRIGAVVVTDGTGSISGILSERDIVKAVARDGVGALDRPTADYMTRTVTTCTPADTIADVMAWMTQGRFRHLPVVDGGRLVGVVSIGDVVKQRIASAEQEAEMMRSYIQMV